MLPPDWFRVLGWFRDDDGSRMVSGHFQDSSGPRTVPGLLWDCFGDRSRVVDLGLFQVGSGLVPGWFRLFLGRFWDASGTVVFGQFLVESRTSRNTSSTFGVSLPSSVLSGVPSSVA